MYDPLNSVQEFVHRDIHCFGYTIHEWWPGPDQPYPNSKKISICLSKRNEAINQHHTKICQWMGSVDWHVNLTFSLGKTVTSGSVGKICGAIPSEFEPV